MNKTEDYSPPHTPPNTQAHFVQAQYTIIICWNKEYFVFAAITKSGNTWESVVTLVLLDEYLFRAAKVIQMLLLSCQEKRHKILNMESGKGWSL